MLTITSPLSKAWDLFQKEWKYIYTMGLVFFLVGAFSSQLLEFITKNAGGGLLQLVASLVTVVISIGLEMMGLFVLLEFLSGKKYEISKLTGLIPEWKRMWTYFSARLIVGLMVVVGLILLIVPGVYFALRYMFVPLLLVDKKMGISEALEKSSKMTEGKLMTLFGVMLVLIGLNVLGALALGVGLLITIPVSSLVPVILYKDLK